MSEKNNIQASNMGNQYERTISIAATFTGEPVEESLNFWGRELKTPLKIKFAPLFLDLTYRIRSFYGRTSDLLCAPFGRLGTLRFRRFTPHPHLTAIKRKNPRLGFFPNFLRYAPKTSLNPNVKINSENGLKSRRGKKLILILASQIRMLVSPYLESLLLL